MYEDKNQVVIIDPSAGANHGHHAHWLQRLTASLDSKGLIYRAIFRKDLSAAPERGWYRQAISEACDGPATDLVFTSGDEAVIPSLLEMRRIRSSKKRVHYLIFRLHPQPRMGGTLIAGAKVGLLLSVRLLFSDAALYTLEMPFQPLSRWRRWLRLTPVIDSSAVEASAPVGKQESATSLRRLFGLASPFILVIGVLTHGKHVDTILDAWERCGLPDITLVFAGEADLQTSALLDAASVLPRVLFIPGRVTDDEFDRLIEAAEVVVTLYRYSASSGVALRALRLGTKVVAGGSRVLVRQLRELPQVVVVKRVTSTTVAAALFQALSAPDVLPMDLLVEPSALYPGPIVDNISGRIS